MHQSFYLRLCAFLRRYCLYLRAAGADASVVDQDGKMPVNVALEIGNQQLVARYLTPNTLAMFAHGRPGCASTICEVQRRFPIDYKHIVDQILAAVTETERKDIYKVAGYVKPCLQKQKLLWAAVSPLKSSDACGWVDRSIARLAYLDCFLNEYVQQLVMVCSVPIKRQPIALQKLDEMLIAPTVVHIRESLVRLLVELDTATSVRLISRLHQNSLDCCEQIFETCASGDRINYEKMCKVRDAFLGLPEGC
jgi:hypothetical protein